MAAYLDAGGARRPRASPPRGEFTVLDAKPLAGSAEDAKARVAELSVRFVRLDAAKAAASELGLAKSACTGWPDAGESRQHRLRFSATFCALHRVGGGGDWPVPDWGTRTLLLYMCPVTPCYSPTCRGQRSAGT